VRRWDEQQVDGCQAQCGRLQADIAMVFQALDVFPETRVQVPVLRQRTLQSAAEQVQVGVKIWHHLRRQLYVNTAPW
jgi:ABC-type polar amino acid transport system ATPase subunit